MRKFSTAILSALFTVSIGTGATLGATWVPTSGQSCDAVCAASGLRAVSSGRYGIGPPYFVCSANVRGEGWRPGYNLKPSWSNACMMEWGNAAARATSYRCLCDSADSTVAGGSIGGGTGPTTGGGQTGGGISSACLAGSWSNALPTLSTDLDLAPDGAGGFNVQETGGCGAFGRAALAGNVLRLRWACPGGDIAGEYVWTVASCASASGSVTFTAGSLTGQQWNSTISKK